MNRAKVISFLIVCNAVAFPSLLGGAKENDFRVFDNLLSSKQTTVVAQSTCLSFNQLIEFDAVSLAKFRLKRLMIKNTRHGYHLWVAHEQESFELNSTQAIKIKGNQKQSTYIKVDMDSCSILEQVKKDL